MRRKRRGERRKKIFILKKWRGERRKRRGDRGRREKCGERGEGRDERIDKC